MGGHESRDRVGDLGAWPDHVCYPHVKLTFLDLLALGKVDFILASDVLVWGGKRTRVG